MGANPPAAGTFPNWNNLPVKPLIIVISTSLVHPCVDEYSGDIEIVHFIASKVSEPGTFTAAKAIANFLEFTKDLTANFSASPVPVFSVSQNFSLIASGMPIMVAFTFKVCRRILFSVFSHFL